MKLVNKNKVRLSSNDDLFHDAILLSKVSKTKHKLCNSFFEFDLKSKTIGKCPFKLSRGSPNFRNYVTNF